MPMIVGAAVNHMNIFFACPHECFSHLSWRDPSWKRVFGVLRCSLHLREGHVNDASAKNKDTVVS